MKGNKRAVMGESSAYRCFARCFSSCLGMKGPHNKTTINGEFLHNGFTPVEEKEIGRIEGDGLTGFGKVKNGKGCCGLSRQNEETSHNYAQVPMSREEDSLASQKVVNGVIITHKETKNGSIHVTTVQPMRTNRDDLKSDMNRTPNISIPSVVKCNPTPEASQNCPLRHSQKRNSNNHNSDDSTSMNGTDTIPCRKNSCNTGLNDVSMRILPQSDNRQYPVTLTEDSPKTVTDDTHMLLVQKHDMTIKSVSVPSNDDRKDVIEVENVATNMVLEVAPTESNRIENNCSESHTGIVPSSPVKEANMKLDSVINMKSGVLELDLISKSAIKELHQKNNKLETSIERDGEHDISYFRKTIECERSRLTVLILEWDKVLSTGMDINEEVLDEIRSVVGQTRLVITERFTQFGSLVDQSEKYQLLTEKEKADVQIITLSDLQGFWDMIYFQVEDVLAKFRKLDGARENGWNFGPHHTENKKPQRRTARPITTRRSNPAKKVTTRSKVTSEEEKARKEAARKRLAEARRKMASQAAQTRTNNAGAPVMIEM